MLKTSMIILLIFMVFIAGCGNPEYKNRMEEGKKLGSEGKYGEAKSAYVAALKAKPMDEDAQANIDAMNAWLEYQKRQQSEKENQATLEAAQAKKDSEEAHLKAEKEAQAKAAMDAEQAKKEKIASLGITVDDLIKSMQKYSAEFISKLKNPPISDLKMGTVKTLQDGFFHFSLTNTSSEIVGVMDKNKNIRWVGVRSEIGSSKDNLNKAAMNAIANVIATQSVIKSVNTKANIDNILGDMVDQRYSQFKDIATYIEGNYKFIEDDSKQFSLFVVCNKEDNLDLTKFR